MDNEWKRQLRRKASLHHMCEDNRVALDNVESKADAVALYLQTIDWALEEDYPGLPTLRRHFADCGDLGVFIDREFTGEILNELPVYVFHNCSGKIRVGLNREKRIVPMLYFANGCDMRVESSNSLGLRTRVPLYIFGDNRVISTRSENMSCVTYNFDVK